jgi:hypothetical protein
MFDIFELFKPIPHPAVVARVAAASPPKPAPESASGETPPAPPPSPSEASTLPIPDEALTFVETEEDGSPAYYVAYYTHWDWPGGASGPTIGVGYDLGQVTRAEAEADWTGIVDPATVAHILTAVGLQGERAQAYVQAHKGEVTITWEEAIAEFKEREVPKWLIRCRAVLPYFDLLPGLCQGALFSLSYNRGTGGYQDPSPRDSEMRAIRQDMIAKNFAAIPAQIESMARLWPTVKDLRDRRMHEAALFRKGLAAATPAKAA